MAGCLGGDALAAVCRAYAEHSGGSCAGVLITLVWCTVFIAVILMTRWSSESSLPLTVSMPMLPRLLRSTLDALFSFMKLFYTCILYGVLLRPVCRRQATVLIWLELVEFATVRIRFGSTAAPFGPLFSVCLQGTLKVLLKVVSMGAAASRRRDDSVCEADQRARAGLPEDLQEALRDGEGRCPITRELMLDPVRTCEWSPSRPGVHVYERQGIEEWLQTSHRSPCTNLPLEHIALEPCVSTRNLVARLLAAQPAPLPLGRWARALEVAAEFAAAMGKLLLSVCLWD